jgi:dihydropteroate synthase
VQQRAQYQVPLPKGAALFLGSRTLIMAVLNVTPDSFSDGGLRADPVRAVEDGLRMLEQGADILDVGGESTRPGADPLGADEEMRRVLPVVERLVERGATVSIDTYKAVVAREATARGASIVNDVHGLQADPQLAEVVAETGAAVVLMHNRGDSREMYRKAVYEDAPREVAVELHAAVDAAVRAGVPRASIIIDPGIGFAKRAAHSFEVLARLEELRAVDRPILAGPSRKSFLKDALGERRADEREWGTAAAVAASVLFGAHIVRVHAIPEMRDVVLVADRIGASFRRP